MLEDELRGLGERVGPNPRPGLEAQVLARLDDRPPTSRRRLWVAAAAAGLVAALGFSPQVRAVAADLLGVAGIEVSRDEPDAVPVPQQPLPSSEVSDLEHALATADIPISVPRALGEPEQVRVADGGRVVSMTWRSGTVVLDQFAGASGPVFAKQVGDLDPAEVDLGGGLPGWWIPGPHDLMYVDREGLVVTATARLAGQTLFWDGTAGVTFRLEGDELTRREATHIARSLRGTS